MKTLFDNDLNVFPLYGENIKFTKLETGLHSISIDSLFGVIYGPNKNRMTKKLMTEISPDAIEGEKSFYFSASKLNRFFTENTLRISTYKKALQTNDNRWNNYIRFIEDGGLDNLCELMSKVDGSEPIQFNQNPDIADHIEIRDSIILQEPVQEEKEEPESKLRKYLTSQDIYLNSTILLAVCLMPFTFSALVEYVSFGDNSIWSRSMSWIMCLGITIAIDWSILVFTINGKSKLALIGSIFQIIFISVHFDLISDLINEVTQSFVTRFSIVLYTAILISQFSKLSSK